MNQFNSTWIIVLLSVSCLSVQCDQKATTDCYPDRKTTTTIRFLNGIVKKVGDTFIIEHQENNTHYLPCNLSDEWKIENQKIIFSGLVKETKTNERSVGTPFVITQIKKRAY